MREHIVGLNHINVVVSDIEKSKDWYCDVLGFVVDEAFEICEDDLSLGLGVPDAQLKVAFLTIPGSTTRVEMIEYASPTSSPLVEGPANAVGFGHFALEVDDVRARYEELMHQGVQFVSRPVDVSGGVRFCWFLDPDGNRVEIIQFGVDAPAA